MKLFIASDIHGSYYFAEKMINAYKSEKCDKLVLLGDILYHGPRNDLPKEYAPKKVIPLLNELKDEIIAIRGNCDAEVDQMVLEFSIMDDYKIIDDEGVRICITHGHVYNEEKLPEESFDVLLSGHTHIPKKIKGGNCICMNPGSVSIPKGNSHHGYMIFENGKFLWKDFDGNEISVKEGE